MRFPVLLFCGCASFLWIPTELVSVSFAQETKPAAAPQKEGMPPSKEEPVGKMTSDSQQDPEYEPPPAPMKEENKASSSAQEPLGSGSATPSKDPLSELDLFAVEKQVEEVTVTATKFARSATESPSIMTVFQREDLDRIGAHTLSDLLKYVPGFYEVAGQFERNFAIRGIHASSASHFVVLIDGVAANDFLFSSSSPDLFNLDDAERVEVVRGPASVIFGASALMSAINIITKDGSQGHRTRAFFRIGSDMSTRIHIDQRFQAGDHGNLYLSGTFLRSGGTHFDVSGDQDILIPALGQNIADGLQAGENLTRPRATMPLTINRYGPGVDLFFRYTRGDRFSVRMGYHRTAFVPQRAYTQALVDRDAEQQPPSYETNRLFFDVEGRVGNTDKWGELTFRLTGFYFLRSFMSQGISREFYDEASAQNSPVILRWSGKDLRIRPSVEYAVRLPFHRIFQETTIYSGFDLQYNNAHSYSMSRCYVDSQNVYAPSPYVDLNAPDLYCTEQMMLRSSLNVDSLGNLTRTKFPNLYGDADEYRLGAFLQLSAYLPHKIGLIAAGRIDFHPIFGPRVSPRVALVAPIAWGFYAKAQFSSAFVYPALLYQIGNSLSDYVGNPDIRPQSTNTFEALLGFAKSSVRIEADFYYNQVKDFIAFDLARNARTGKYRFANQGNLDVLGVEATARVALWKERLRFSASFGHAIPMENSSPGLVFDKQFTGPTKFPTYMATLNADVSPWPFLSLQTGLFYVSQVSPYFYREQQFQDIQGTDGQLYTSRAGSDYPTEAVTWDLHVRFEGKPSMTRSPRVNAVLSKIMLAFGMQNVVGSQVYRPGSVLVPYAQPNRVIFANVGIHF